MIRVGVRPAAIAAHYLGGEIGAEMALPKPAGALMEVAHFHALILAVVFLILAHLFAATGFSPRAKRAWVGLALASSATDLVGPWLVRYAGGGCAARRRPISLKPHMQGRRAASSSAKSPVAATRRRKSV